MTNVFHFGSGYRAFTSYWWRHWFNPRTYYMPFVWGFQRVTRGWADCDVWSIDWWLSEIIPATVDRLRILDNGHPSELTPEEWAQILLEIAEGFRAAQLSKEVPEEFITRLETSTGWQAQLGLKDSVYDWEGIKAYEATQQKKFEHGAALFVKYYHGLWD